MSWGLSVITCACDYILHTQMWYYWHYGCQESERPKFEQWLVNINFLSIFVHIYKEELMCLCCKAIKQLFILIYKLDHISQNCLPKLCFIQGKIKAP